MCVRTSIVGVPTIEHVHSAPFVRHDQKKRIVSAALCVRDNDEIGAPLCSAQRTWCSNTLQHGEDFFKVLESQVAIYGVVIYEVHGGQGRW